jgi:hypothetical protein
VGRERERKKNNKTNILRVRSKRKKQLLLKKNMDLSEKIIPFIPEDYFIRCNELLEQFAVA